MNRNGPVVMQQSAESIVHDARLLGHADIDVYPTRSGAKWRVDCVCGWEGTGMVRQVEAISKGRYHLVNVVMQLRRYASSHGIPYVTALSEFALSERELEDLDIAVNERREHRQRVSLA